MNKKKILVIGYSSFFQRRVLPSLKKIKNLKIFICSKSYKFNKNHNTYFDDYDFALDNYHFDLVYISLINPMHFELAKKALKKTEKVIIDKPITLNFNQTNNLIKLAKRDKKLISELTIFNYHLVFKKIDTIFNGIKNIEYINSNFNIPRPKNLNQFLIKQNDCIQDMSPYASAMIRIFLSGKINNFLVNKKYFSNNKKIAKEFTLFASNKFTSYVGNFGVDKEYESKIVFYGSNKILEIPFQAFALPSDKKIIFKLKYKNKVKEIQLFDDYIKRYFQEILFLKKNNNYYLDKILVDNNIKRKLKLI